ncbi:hypothetical protein RclHR1_17130004 [Rhizophagus clarus]|uniref:Uncharacterized protein n=1 Tax=Rhizophagus clarus TaxID=94130 RepID=A0A2Z6QNF5_9GLOM|nr:hypothetical protein RclHR1_17130004 [Rhizophagus clarus]
MDIELTCRLHKSPGKYVIQVNTGNTVGSLVEEIKRVFDCNEARDIVLWKTNLPNELEDAFKNLILAEGDNLTELTAGELNRFWGEDLGRPLKDHTHIIIDSPALVYKQEIDRLREESELYLDENASDYIIPSGPRTGGSYLKDLFHAKIIRVNDVLRMEKPNKGVHIRCKVTNFDEGILSVTLIDHNEEQKGGIFLLRQLEEWLLKHSFDAENRTSDYDNSGDNIEIIRNERLLGSIRMRRNCYIYNQKNRKDSTKSESKQDADSSEILSRLSITGNNVLSISKESICEIRQILNDPNVLDMFFGSEEPPYVKQNLYIVVNRMPEIKLQSLGEFMIIYIEWGTFTENLPLNDPPQEALSSKDIEKFNNILDTELGDDFRSKHHNLIAISLYWKIRNGLYENVPAIVFYVIRKNILPHNNTFFPGNIGGFITDVCEGFYEPSVIKRGEIDCCEYKEMVSPGSSIGVKSRVGTLGFFVKDSNQKIYLMTNEQVVSGYNSEYIHQPSVFDYIGRSLDDLASSLKTLEELLFKDKQLNDSEKKLIMIESFNPKNVMNEEHGKLHSALIEKLKELESVISILNEVIVEEDGNNIKHQDLLRMLETFNKLLMFRTENELENEKKEELQVELEKLEELQIMFKLNRLECEFNKMKEEWNEISNTDNEFFKNKLSKKLKFLDTKYQTCIENKKKFESAKQKDTKFALITKGIRDNYKFGQYKYGVDAAIALILTDKREYNPSNSNLAIRDSSFNVYNIPKIRLSGLKENIDDSASRRIFKVGRTTGLTEGEIKEIPISVNTENIMRRQVGIFHDILMEGDKILRNKDIWLDRQILVKAKKGTFMDGGDSGCAWFDIDGNVVALGHGSILIRGIDYGVGSPIYVVLKAFSPLELSFYTE